MAYIDYSYYKDEYHGKFIPQEEFDRIAEIASMIIDAIVYCQIDTSCHYIDSVKKAAAYEADTIFAYGGEDVAFGLSDASIGSENLGDYSYSVSGGESSSHSVAMYQGIPVSPIVISLLSNAGLRRRWAYAYCEDGDDDA